MGRDKVAAAARSKQPIEPRTGSPRARTEDEKKQIKRREKRKHHTHTYAHTQAYTRILSSIQCTHKSNSYLRALQLALINHPHTPLANNRSTDKKKPVLPGNPLADWEIEKSTDSASSWEQILCDAARIAHVAGIRPPAGLFRSRGTLLEDFYSIHDNRRWPTPMNNAGQGSNVRSRRLLKSLSLWSSGAVACCKQNSKIRGPETCGTRNDSDQKPPSRRCCTCDGYRCSGTTVAPIIQANSLVCTTFIITCNRPSQFTIHPLPWLVKCSFTGHGIL